jgi:phage-related protein
MARTYEARPGLEVAGCLHSLHHGLHRTRGHQVAAIEDAVEFGQRVRGRRWARRCGRQLARLGIFPSMLPMHTFYWVAEHFGEQAPKGSIKEGKLADLKAFPATAMDDMGHQLFRVQCGLDPDDWKPMVSIGSGVRETRVRDPSGAFRTIYFATRPEAIYVLHCFRKKTPKTAR